MTEQAVATPPERQGISAQLQERVRAFTKFYEANAYLAYNLALRIACAPGPAQRAVHRAFLRQLDEQPSGLVAATVEAALQADSGRADPSAAGDPEAQALMSAASELAPAERAVLALADLAECEADGVSAALGLAEEQAAALLDRARESFASHLGRPRPEADEAARDWMWAAPPQEIWEELYPEFHRSVERQLRRGEVEHTLVLQAGRTAGAPKKSRSRATRAALRRTGRRRAWLPSRPRLLIPIVAIVLGLGGVAAAQLLPRDEGAGSAPSFSPDASPTPSQQLADQSASGEGVKPHKPLTAALLDKLRLRELRQLRNYTKRQADASLPARQRRAAARRVAALERAARDRLLAQRKREAAALRDREARERAAAKAPPPPPPSVDRPASQPRPTTQTPKSETTDATAPPSNRQEADESCLLDEDSGQYICPR